MKNCLTNVCRDGLVASFEKGWKGRLCGLFSLAVLGLGGLPANAAPIVDTFENTLMLSSTLGSSLFDISSGDLVVTPAETSPGVWGALGGQSIFIWSLDGGKFAGFWLTPTEEQYVMQLTGVQNVTPAGKNDAFMYGFVYLFAAGGDPVTSYFDVNPVDGNFTLNVYDAAMATLGSVPDNLRWTVEFYVASGGQEGVGYQFESIAAVPEPSSIAMLLVGSCVAIGVYSLRRKRASSDLN